MALGLAVAAGLVVSMQLPLMHQRAVVHAHLESIVKGVGDVAPLSWPSIGSAALDIPALGVAVGWNNRVVPIASLTKMMTAYVTLEKLPLSVGQTGPCTTITENDVLAYEFEKLAGQSTALVVVGERLCEIDLLNGLLVHSAGNYADVLASMVAGTPEAFIASMNASAATLGLRATHYDDVTGFSPLSVSTALDQAKLAVVLMKSPLVRAIVRQPSVTLPVAGLVNSFTPLVGTANVVGVKSGRTDEAGGCDVLALTFEQGGLTRIIYAVVLGQRGGDLLSPAGAAALALAQSALANRVELTFAKGTKVGRIGWGKRTVEFGFARDHLFTFWVPRSSLSVALHMKRFTTTIRRGEVVGWVRVRGAATRMALVAQATVAPPTIWQRLL
jgi:D-alanyl-D-alanine carboxypeptidase (penicillin-binding protein 5/6)